MILNFDGQVVLITGATRGIGKQIADDLESLGARLLLTGTKRDEIEILNNNSDSNRSYFTVDFSNQDSTKKFLESVQKFDKIDILINNAGTNRIDLLDETDIEDWYSLLAINLTAPYLLMRSISSLMKKHRYGRIVNITSIWAHISMVKRSIYTATKFGLRGLTVSTANELAPFNVLVNSVAPGFTKTELSQRTLGEEGVRQASEKIPMKRFAEPEEISKVVIFLASSLNTYLTGQSIVVDGGFTNV